MTTLAEALAEMFKEDFEEIFQREMKEEAFMAHNHYKSCEMRARTAITMASDRAVKTLGLVIANHREAVHRDNTAVEQAVLLESGADPEVSARVWWSH